MRAIRIAIILLLCNGPLKYFSQEQVTWSYKNTDQCLNISDENAIIANSDFNIPTLEIDSEVTPISLTHHGNYGAFAIA